MKRFLEHKLTVKQFIALFLISLGLVSIVVVFTTGGSSAPVLSQEDTADKVKFPEELAVEDTGAYHRLQQFIDSLNQCSELRGGGWTFCLKPVDSDSIWLKVDEQRGYVPASVMKVVTTATALSLLGPSWRYTTSLSAAGEVSEGTLKGNLIIRGNGDPSLGSESFGSSVEKVIQEWADAVEKSGIDSVDGFVIGDGEAFERDMVAGGWSWEDIQSDYGAGPSGLSIHENQFDVLVTPSGNGASLKCSPRIPGLKLHNACIRNSAIQKSYAYITGGPYQFEKSVVGEISSALEVKGSVPDPPLLCAQLLEAELESRGIGVRDSATTKRRMKLSGDAAIESASRKVIHTRNSPALADLVYHTNQISQNFYAESILKAIAWKSKGYGSTYGAVSVVYEFWKNHGIDLTGMCMVDGSGLSRNNSLSTKQLVEMLSTIAHDSVVFPAFYRSLPVAGESGTIRKLADGTAAEGNVRAKSGTMSRVRSYAGYVDTRSGKRLAFAMMANNTQWESVQIKQLFERLFVLMAELN